MTHPITEIPDEGEQIEQAAQPVAPNKILFLAYRPIASFGNSPAPLLSSHAILIQTVLRANRHTNIDALYDVLYGSLFLMGAAELRIALNIPPSVSVYEGLQRENPLGFMYLGFAEVAAAQWVDNYMREMEIAPGCMLVSAVQERAITLTAMFQVHYHHVCKVMKVDFVTGKSTLLDIPF
jgi:hypothetical protein